jgi:UDP:flavonoid glycosyltransferase YjiC (YdhE family)
MARYMFLTWDGAGNQPPTIGIAQALRDRGHDVAFAGYESQRELFSAHGFRFVLLERSAALWHEATCSKSVFAAKMETVWASPQHLDEIPELLVREPCDVLVVDCLMFGALVAAETNCIPAAALVHSAPGALVPPGGRFEAALLGPVNRVRAMAEQPALASIWDAWTHFPAFCTSIPELDPLAMQAPSSFQYIGPIFERAPASGWRLPWKADDVRALVLVSFSTGPYWDQASRIRRTIEALADHDYRVLITTGSTDVADIVVPGNVVLVRHVPHAEILPDVAVTVTHAGHGTVVASLAHGVPMVCLPNPAADQPALAARVQALGAGVALEGEGATAAEIAAAVHQMLADASYAATARRLAEKIAATPGVAMVTRRLEQFAQPTLASLCRMNAGANVAP